jgi:hypothetical protein
VKAFASAMGDGAAWYVDNVLAGFAEHPLQATGVVGAGYRVAAGNPRNPDRPTHDRPGARRLIRYPCGVSVETSGRTP